jgi:predicted DCC family thiol-disulfide oxidoreductase YuxK
VEQQLVSSTDLSPTLSDVRQLQDLIYAFIAANRYRLALPKDQPYCNSILTNADEGFALL